MLWIGEVEDAKSIDVLITSASIKGKTILDFENLDLKICKRTQENPDRELQENKSPQPKDKLNPRSDRFRADRLLG